MCKRLYVRIRARLSGDHWNLSPLLRPLTGTRYHCLPQSAFDFLENTPLTSESRQFTTTTTATKFKVSYLLLPAHCYRLTSARWVSYRFHSPLSQSNCERSFDKISPPALHNYDEPPGRPTERDGVI
jgi:hypothetical protein